MAAESLHTSASKQSRTLDAATIEWIEAALAATPHGEVILTVQDHRVVGIDLRGRKRFLKPRVDRRCGGDDTSR